VLNRTNKTVAGYDVSDFITKTVNNAGKLATVAAPVGAVMAAAPALNAAWSAYLAAGSALHAAGSAGALAKAWVWIAGGNTAAELAATAATAATAAKSAIMTSVTGLGACAGVYIGYKLLKNVLTDWKREEILEKLPDLVKEDLSSCIGEIIEKLNNFCDERIEDMRDAIFERISAVEEQEKKYLEARKSKDPSIAERMKDELDSVHGLEKRFAELKNLVRAEVAENE
jgi:hypothetical protein